jgi:hypothetical protein
MRCPQCQERFKANWQVDCAPGGQEAPATFLIVASICFGLGAVLHLLAGGLWPWVLYGIVVFVLVQVGVAWTDCCGTCCPRCEFKVRVWPWSR